ncbi:hypothetical protein EI94DRAFT_1919859 [Lactarius quietus]|nr:hypothetical protein EI94DRAFT_1919859 [Lactarius quietus]
MPHKRAKRTVRDQQRKERGTDLAPPGASSTALSNERVPKSVSRVLDAARIRAEYRKKKRAHEEDGGADTPKLPRNVIKPGESLKHFNRRVEDHMRPLVQSAMRASTATVRKERRSAAPQWTGLHEDQKLARRRMRDDYDKYSSGAPRATKGVRDEFERSTASSQRYRNCTASVKEAPARGF